MSQIQLPGYFNPRQDESEEWRRGFPGYWPKRPVDNRGRLKEIYQTELGREADKEGLDYWANQLETGNQTIDQFKKNIRDSDEGRTRFIKNTYMDLLGREGDAEGMAYWDNELKSGKSRDQIQESIISSDEARKYRANDKGRGARPPKEFGGQDRPPKGRPIGDDQLDPGELKGGTGSDKDDLVDTNISGEDADVQAICNAAWTTQVKADYRALLIAQKNSP